MTKARTDHRALGAYFECAAHSNSVLTGLQVLRRQGLLVDITLKAGGEPFYAHKVVLAACSDYFRAMFTDAMKESRESEITLNGVTAVGMRLLLEFVYSSRLDLTLANVQDVLSAASHLQLVAVVELCSIFLQTQLDLDNCIDIATLAETYSLKSLRYHVYLFMCSNLRDLARSADLQRLTLPQMEHLLTCDFPVDCSEAEVLEIVLKWIRSVPDIPSNAVLKVMRHINYFEIPLETTENSISTISDPCISSKILREARASAPLRKKDDVVTLLNSRGMELAIVKAGGFGIGGITNEVTYYSAGKWHYLTSIPHVEQCNFGTTVLDNKLYVVGGCFNLSLQESIHPFGFRYCPQVNEWHTIAPMHRERCRFSLNVVSGCLYAVGGNTEEEDNRDDDVSLCERYIPSNDCWEIVASAPGHRSQHAGAAWPAVSPHILFISGGLERDNVLRSLQCYDVASATWHDKAPMLLPRADHVMLTIGNDLYVCGGWCDGVEIGSRVLVDAIDRYDVVKDTWETVTRIPSPRYHAGIVSVGQKVYIIGGFHSDGLFDRYTASVDCYDFETNTWNSMENYPENVWEHCCVTLYVPRCRNDLVM